MRDVEAKLFEIANKVYYGSADDKDNLPLWNYIVFFRDVIRRGTNNTGYTDYFTVAIVQENFIPDEMIEETISKLETLQGVRLAGQDIDYNYTRKPGTNAVIEIATIPFCRARKRVK